MSKVFVKDKREAALEKTYRYLKTHKGIQNGAIGYLSAFLVNTLDNLSSASVNDVLKDIFLNYTKIGNIGFYLAAAIIVIRTVMLFFLKKYFKGKTEDRRLRDIYEEYSNSIFDGHETEGISWGWGQTVTSAPDIQKGWATSNIKFEVDTSLYNIQMLRTLDPSFQSRDFQKEYDLYVRDEFPQYYKTDSDRLMLKEKPVSLTDDYALTIKLKRVKWSQLQFFWNQVLTDKIKKICIDKLFYDNMIVQVNSFCLHLIVKTSDGKILITEVSPNKDNDYAKSWAVSIGEQIDMEDVKNLDADCSYAWVKRALYEELSINDDEFQKENIRFLSINLEGNIVNFAFVCVVEIVLDSDDLVNRLHTSSRVDNEFKHLDFMDIDEIPAELIKNRRNYHPSSEIRMLYTYLNTKGSAELRLQLLKEKFES